MEERDVTIELIGRFLEARQWRYRVAEGGLIESGFYGTTARFPVRLWLRDQPVVALTVVVDQPFIVSEERRGQIAEAVARANCGTGPARFDFDMSEGSICCVGILPICDNELTQEQFDALFDCALSMSDRYFKAFARLLYGDDLSPAEVIAEVEMAK